jgi:hypothetical protein
VTTPLLRCRPRSFSLHEWFESDRARTPGKPLWARFEFLGPDHLSEKAETAQRRQEAAKSASKRTREEKRESASKVADEPFFLRMHTSSCFRKTKCETQLERDK